jgi:3-dehydroquinate synthase II
LGACILIEDQDGQEAALEFVGLAQWLLLDCLDWTMIPLENLVAAAQGSGTKIAACIHEESQLQGATFALQSGVDALLLTAEKSMWDTAELLAAERLAETGGVVEESDGVLGELVELVPLEIISVTPGGVGDRVCVDLVQNLELGEGLLIGSSSNALCLVHGETIESDFVPPRPFRVNAGPVHSYILLADGSTRYLCELEAGDEVLVTSISGSRSVAVGRLKIEQRPLLLARFRTKNNSGEDDVEGQIFLQQAETVRLVGVSTETPSITHIQAGELVLGSVGGAGRHLGRPIGSEVEER